VCCDYSQIEVRILAHVSGDPTLIKAFEDGEDIHEAVAKRAFNTDEPTKDQRSAAKTITFGLIYGMSAPSLARRLGVTLHEAEDFIDAYFEAMPTVQDWIERVHSEARKNGYVTTLFGRRIRIPNCNSKDDKLRARAMRQSVNYIIQGSAADLMRLALAAVRRRVRKWGTVLLSVHDEIIVECPENIVELVSAAVGKAMRECSEAWIDWRVPIVADAEHGKDWREAKGGD
jgi:DNA polymerase-1